MVPVGPIFGLTYPGAHTVQGLTRMVAQEGRGMRVVHLDGRLDLRNHHLAAIDVVRLPGDIVGVG